MSARLYHLDEDWYEWRQEPPLAATVHVRVVADAGGRLGLAELRIVGEPTSELLRAIPVGRIEAAANAQLTVVDDAVTPGSVRAHERRRTAGRPGPNGRPDRNGGANAEPGAGTWADADPGGWAAPGPGRAAGAPRTQGRPDRFYAEIADAYRHLAPSSRRPAGELAARYDVPVTTVHRWVKEARRRGFLAPGRPGKAG